MAEIDLSALLRDLSRAIVELRAFVVARRSSPTDVAEVDPFQARRWVSTRTTLEALLDRPRDPAAPRLAAWVLSLLTARVNLGAELEALRSRETSIVRLLAPKAEELSLRQAIHRLIQERDASLRAECARAIERAAGESAASARELWARRGELDKRLKLPGIEALRSPLTEPEALSRIAGLTLASTDEIARSLRPGNTWFEALTLGFGQDESVPWPKQLSARQLGEMFRGEAGWLDIPDLSAGALVAILGGSSVTRAFARFGARWADAACSREMPRPLAQHPNQLDRLSTGALFAALLLSPLFLSRAFGMSRAEAERAARSQARVALVALRLSAARCLARPAALAGDRDALYGALEEQLSRALGAVLPSNLALVLPRLREEDPARLLAFGQGALLAERLREQHDEDWFRNPRAVLDLRDRLGRLPIAQLPTGEAEQGISAAARLLSPWLS